MKDDCLRSLSYIDPTLDLDIYADKPWALSPALASMTSLSLINEAQSGVVVKEDSVDKLKEQDGRSSAPRLDIVLTLFRASRRWSG
jgi:hypothetical protein